MKFILADETHDEQLRCMVRSEEMPGHLKIRYEREPRFFDALSLLGPFTQVVTAIKDEKILGYGCRSIRPLFVNGELINFGYLSSLRSLPSVRGSLGLAKGYRYLKKLHEDGRCSGYLTTIIHGNETAINTIAQGRAGLPYYKSLGTGITASIALRKNRRYFDRGNHGVQVRFALPGEENLVIDLLSKYGKEKQFFPNYTQEDIGEETLQGLPIEKFLLAKSGSHYCGVAAVWNQSQCKQQKVAAYDGKIAMMKRLFNPLCRTLGFPQLPELEQELRMGYFCFHAVENHQESILQALLDFACDHLSNEGYSFCLLGLHHEDTMCKILKKYLCLKYLSHLYYVGWEEDMKLYENLDARVINFEPAIL